MNFWDNLTPLDLWLYIIGLLLVAFILVMEYQARTVDTYVWGLFAIVFSLITGKSLPTPGALVTLNKTLDKIPDVSPATGNK